MKSILFYARGGKAYRRWYVHARLVIKRVAELTEQSTERVADVLAITSPRCVVNRNLVVTYQYLRGQGLPNDVTRSTRSALKHWEGTGKIRGPKTGAFAKVLRGDDSILVVDSHLARAFGYSEKVARSLYCRRAIGSRVRRIAKRFGWSVAESQAAIWAGYYKATYLKGNVPLYNIKVIVPF